MRARSTQPNLPEGGLHLLLKEEARKMVGEARTMAGVLLTCFRLGWMAATDYPSWLKRQRRGCSRDAPRGE